jgi:hypothetical protein
MLFVCMYVCMYVCMHTYCIYTHACIQVLNDLLKMYVYESNYALINAVSKDCLCQCLSSISRLYFSERDSSPTLNSALLHAQRGPDLTETDIGK